MIRAAADLEYRLATAADNEAILRFYAAHSMQAGVELRFDRKPDFFALLNAHSPDNETWLLLEQKEIRAAASLVLRHAYVDGVKERVAYLGDLRANADLRVSALWRQHFAERLARLGAEDQVRLAYTCIIRNNARARNALLRRRGGKAPHYAHLRGYSNVTMFARKFGRGHRKTRRSDIRVRPAVAADTTPLREFIDSESRRQAFGVVFDALTWQRRLESWPGFGLQNFLIACDTRGQIVGCLAPWDYAALKRIVIDHLTTEMRALACIYNILTPLSGRPKLRSNGGLVLPDIALSHVFVRQRDPVIFAALLADAYRRIARTRQYATVSLCLYDDDPLWPAMNDYWCHKVSMDLFTVQMSAPASPPEPAGSAVPGFEMYLV